MSKHMPVCVGVLGAILSFVWLYVERLMGITLFAAMLRSAILTLADTLFGGREAGFFLALPVTMLYGLAAGVIAALLCRAALSRINRRDPHAPHQPKWVLESMGFDAGHPVHYEA